MRSPLPLRTLLVAPLLTLLTGAAYAPAGDPEGHLSKYAGLESREIKTFSPEDLDQLRAGHGWGLSLVAELNGVPGPRHLLDMGEELGLSPEQTEAIRAIYDRMKAEAIPLGNDYIRQESELDRAFASRRLDEAELDRRVTEIALTRGKLRGVHLAAHLRTLPILTQEQVRSYSTLRGYTAGDPCAAVPPGHDPGMWRLHNHCDG